jgi:hypothetical protein
MTKNDYQIQLFVLDCIDEPLLLDGVLDPLNDRIVGIASEVEDEPKG